MKRLNRHLGIIPVVLGLLVAFVLPGWHVAAAESTTDDAAWKELPAYRFGDRREALARIERQVQAAASNADQQRELAAKFSAVLVSSATLEAKQFACRQLSLIGAAAEVPVLARLLSDPDLASHARFALERIPGDASLAALQSALATTSGSLRIGVINSLAVRRGNPAVPELAKLITQADTPTAIAALEALGAIGSADAVKALKTAETQLPPTLQLTAQRALLNCAGQLLQAGHHAEATVILEPLTAPGQSAYLRTAAFPLLVASLGEKGKDRILSALTGTDVIPQAAAIQALRLTSDPALLRTAAGQLPKLIPDLAVRVITLLGDRGESVVLPAVQQAAASQDGNVRRAAISALGQLGDASTVAFLAGLAVKANDEDRKILVEALARLNRPGVEDALIATLKTAPPVVQGDFLRALVLRDCTNAIPAFLEAARSPQLGVRREAYSALGKLAGPGACVPLIQRLDPAVPGDADLVANALGAICRRHNSVEPVVAALAAAAPVRQISLLKVLAIAGSSPALTAIRGKINAPEPEVRTTAVRILADWPDSAPLDDLFNVAATTSETTVKTLALRGLARMAPQAKDRSAAQTVDLLSRALNFGAAVAEQKLLLSALSEVPDASALKAATTQLDQPDLVDEAAMAILKIAEALGRPHRTEVKAALDQVKARCKNPTILAQVATTSLKFGDWENLSLGAKASSPDGLEADGQAGGDQAAIDGDPQTYWDEADNQKLYVLRVQLKQRSKVVFLRLLGWQQHNYAPKDFEVVVDGKPVKKIENATYNHNWLAIDFTPVEGSVVELRITGYHGQSPAIRELEIYGQPAPTGRADVVPGTVNYTWNQASNFLALLHQGQTVWRLNFDPREGKPYFHPLTLPGGIELTALRPADHPWHRALWWSWKFINGVNYWEEDRKTGQAAGLTELLRTQATPNPDGSARVEMDLAYHPPAVAPLLTEKRVLLMSAPDANGSYHIDWQSTFVAEGQSVKLDRTPFTGVIGGAGFGGYAGLSLRLTPAFRSWLLVTSEASEGEKLLHGKRARWVDFTGHLPNQGTAGVAMFDHPNNLRHPTPWYAKQDMPYFSVAPLFHEPLVLAKGERLELRYRILVHAGSLEREALEKTAQNFSQP